jgi:hypothetical protein
MNRTTNIARRTSLMVTMAGAVALGAVALAPAASAATVTAVDGTYTVIDGPSLNGPDAFLVTGNGRTPIFFCDASKPEQRQSNCQPDPDGGTRY